MIVHFSIHLNKCQLLLTLNSEQILVKKSNLPSLGQVILKMILEAEE